jgi:hypothetical protein
MGNQKEEGQTNASGNAKEGPKVKESPRDGAETKSDLESQHPTTPEKPLYVTNGLKRRVFPEFFKRMNQLFNDDRSRRALVCASTAMISQQLCGVNTIGKHHLFIDISMDFSFSTSISPRYVTTSSIEADVTVSYSIPICDTPK